MIYGMVQETVQEYLFRSIVRRAVPGALEENFSIVNGAAKGSRPRGQRQAPFALGAPQATTTRGSSWAAGTVLKAMVTAPTTMGHRATGQSQGAGTAHGAPGAAGPGVVPGLASPVGLPRLEAGPSA